jgi:hypothetical protein
MLDLHAIAASASEPKKRKTQSKTLPVSKRPIATIDFETDPFLYGRVPAPFVAGFFSADLGFINFWGRDCVSHLCDFLLTLETPHIVYAHNGGRFDFHFMLDHLENPVKIINGRIASVKLGPHTLRDSYCILPIPLRVYCKDEIDYRLLEAENREANKTEIVSYLKTDCEKLHELVLKFIERFGVSLTIGGTAIKELKKLHPFNSTGQMHDAKFRPYYFGGRVETFETGILRGAWRVYDVNSMYPGVMKNCQHPTGSRYFTGYNRIIDKRGRVAGFAEAPFYFAKVECQQRGAFPMRANNAPLDFNVRRGVFWITSHELHAAIEAGRVSDVRALEVHVPAQTISFGDFVDKFIGEKIAAKLSHDKAGEIFAKLIANSSYGKFGSNPANYFDYILGEPPSADYEIYSAGVNQVSIWRRPSAALRFYDVATAASITGAARAVLMRALAHAVRPVYCDTDSIICESLDCELHDSKLGAWKLEAEGDTIAVIGKKMYALRAGTEYVKTASKGVILTGPEIFGLASGSGVHWHNMAPSFSIKNPPRFVDRKIISKFA